MAQALHPNTRAVRAACERLGIPSVVHDDFGNFLEVKTDPVRFFVNAAMPFNTGSVEKICKDKEFSWKLLRDVVSMPKSKGYFDPFPRDARYQAYVREPSYDAIADSMLEEFMLPMIVKMNSGQEGKNVYLCKDRDEVFSAITTILNHDLPSHDSVVLAQEYIPKVREYRAVVFREAVMLVYEKDISDASFAGNLSPLHYENARAVQVTDPSCIERIADAVKEIFPILPLEYGGIDLIEDEHGTFHVLELNTHPGFNYFVRDNGDEPLIRMFEQILKSL